MTGGDWIGAAMCDDSLVAEALICLLHTEPLPAPPPEKSGASDLKLKWNVRQRRTKAASSRKKGDHTRASPTTPLSWSGNTSLSGGGGGGSGAAAVDGFEESSGAVKLSEAVRSKISQTSVTTTPFKRSRKKKTLAELKEEESLLLKERKDLKNELASMRDLLKQQRERNESLKKMQVSHISLQAESQKNDDSFFVLPDLNIPLDNNLSPEVTYGTS